MLMQRSTPAGLAVSLDTLKDALRVTGTDNDDRLERLIRSETARYEAFCGRVLLPTDFRLSLRGWSFPVELPRAPVREVTEVSYLDADHVLQDLDADDWFATEATPFWSVDLVSTIRLPVLSDRPWPVRVEFTAGHDDLAESGGGLDPALATRADDAEAIIHLVGTAYDQGEVMPFDRMRQAFGARRIIA